MPEFVSVPVPADRVQEVYELLARPPFGRGSGRPVHDNGDGEVWSRPLIDRMFVESSEAMRRILSAIAEVSPGWVTTSDISVASGLTPRQVVASLGPFEKRVRGRYGMSRWPFEAREFVDAAVFKYSMSPETAARILELAAEVKEHGGTATSGHAMDGGLRRA